MGMGYIGFPEIGEPRSRRRPKRKRILKGVLIMPSDENQEDKDPK